MSSITVGDKVRLKVDSPEVEGQFSRGNEYTVVSVTGYGIKVAEDDSGDENGWVAKHFEPVANIGPIRTVTRREIVPGKYGIVTIKECGFIHINAMGTPEKLREASHILVQLAEVLEDE